jgi:drug/metabolite transporter (DMT)-like permease
MALLILSNTVYQVCSKSVPSDVHPLAALCVTYAIGTVASALLFWTLSKGGSLVKELSHLNWAPFVLGFVVVGLEVGWIFAYRAGWQVSTGFIVHSAFLAIALIAVGALVYHEPITATKVAGIAICLVGMWLINR